MLIYGFFTAIFNILTTHALLSRRKSIPYCIAAFILNTLFVLGIIIPSMKYIPNLTIVKYVVFSAAFLYVIYVHLVFKESIQKKIFTMLSICILSTVSLYVAVITMRLFTGTIDANYHDHIINGFRLFLQLLALAAIHYKLKTPYKKTLELVPDKTINFMSLYPLTAYLVLINDYPTTFPHFRYFDPFYEMVVFIVLIVLGYFLVFEGISSASQMAALQYNYKIIENQVESQRQNYKRLNESLEQLYALKHDVRHHFSAMKSMLNEKKHEQALEYIEQFNQNELSKTTPTLCHNFTADSILKYYFSIAANKDIDFRTNLNIPEDININPLDLCVVLGNCLENAIEACDRLDDGNRKYISIASQMVNSHLVFKIINSFNGNIIKNGETMQSTKNESSHGIGISSIRETVKKYKGNLDIRNTKNEFEVDIIMNINSTKYM
ncbi:MAG: hypothetical protein APF84_09330 [Gracilibacter sp. BRH_c7a]|nr:MAG: hypothetical protein APF84_09330 [Gracilibacter sp. BRH_c7a]